MIPAPRALPAEGLSACRAGRRRPQSCQAPADGRPGTHPARHRRGRRRRAVQRTAGARHRRGHPGSCAAISPPTTSPPCSRARSSRWSSATAGARSMCCRSSTADRRCGSPSMILKKQRKRPRSARREHVHGLRRGHAHGLDRSVRADGRCRRAHRAHLDYAPVHHRPRRQHGDADADAALPVRRAHRAAGPAFS